MERYTAHLEESGDLDTLPMTKIATNNTQTLISNLEKKKNYEDAKIIRLLSLGGVYDKNQHLISKYSKIDTDEEDKHEQFMENLWHYKPERSDLLAVITWDQAQKLFEFGQPLLACAANLSINDFEGAFMKLYWAGEFYFAFALSELIYPEGTKLLYSFIGEKAEIYGTQIEIMTCFKNAFDTTRYTYLTSAGKAPDGISMSEIDGPDFDFPKSILG